MGKADARGDARLGASLRRWPEHLPGARSPAAAGVRATGHRTGTLHLPRLSGRLALRRYRLQLAHLFPAASRARAAGLRNVVEPHAGGRRAADGEHPAGRAGGRVRGSAAEYATLRQQLGGCGAASQRLGGGADRQRSAPRPVAAEPLDLGRPALAVVPRRWHVDRRPADAGARPQPRSRLGRHQYARRLQRSLRRLQAAGKRDRDHRDGDQVTLVAPATAQGPPLCFRPDHLRREDQQVPGPGPDRLALGRPRAERRDDLLHSLRPRPDAPAIPRGVHRLRRLRPEHAVRRPRRQHRPHPRGPAADPRRLPSG